MQPLRNLASFVAVLLIMAVPGALGVAYFRNYSPEGGHGGAGHHHGDMPADKQKAGPGSDHSPAAAQKSDASASRPPKPAPSGLLHIGADGFFLNDASGLRLTPGQLSPLRAIQMRATAEMQEAEKKIAVLEQELWTLTGSAQPELGAIERKARELEKLRADQRIQFIRHVAEAARVLTPDQANQVLTATRKPSAESGAKPAEPPHKH